MGATVPLVILLGFGVFVHVRRREHGRGNQPQPRPHSQEVSESDKRQETLSHSPTSPDLPYTPYVSPPLVLSRFFRVGD